MSSQQSSGNVNVFGSSVSLQSLQEGTEIIMDTENAADFSSSDEDYFSEASFQTFKKELESICNDGEDDPVDLSSFEALAAKMLPITDDGLVKKLVLKPGNGPILPPKSLVVIHYNGFFEKQTVPFDSTYQRNSPFRFLLGDGKLVHGLDLGVATMKKDEVSAFLVHYDYAYGPMGCPPRIPATATVFFEVQVVNYIDSGDAVEFERMSAEEQRTVPFSKIYAVCRSEHELGNNLYKNRMFKGAISWYRKAAELLADVNVANEEEDDKRLSLLRKLYMNLSLCYLKIRNAKKCRINAQDVLRQDQNNTKALYLLAKSYFLDGEYDDALRNLYRAHDIEPDNADIEKVIAEVKKKKKLYDEGAKAFCKNIFGGKKKQEQFNEPQEFVDSIKEIVQRFKESEDRDYSFPSLFTPSQVEDIKLVASLNGVHFIEKIHDGNKITKLCK